jgi:vitamin B12 transporter
MKYILLSAFLFAAIVPAFSQDSSAVDSLKSKVLNEVVISTSRTEKEASTEPRSVTVINTQQIAASNVKTLPELLSQVEGIYILGAGMNPGTNLSLYTRGTNANQTAILLDGILLNDPSSPNSAFDISDLTLNSIERIEIVRGSNSAVYGSGAIGGSINIITRDKGDKPFEANADFRFGTDYNISNALIRYTDKSGVYASVGLNSISSKGFDAVLDTSSKKPIQPNDLDRFQQTDIIGKIGYDKNKLKISAFAKVLQKQGDIDRSPFTNDNNYTLETNRNVYNLKARYAFSNKFSLEGFTSYSQNERISINDSSLVRISPDTAYDHSYFKGTYTGNNLQSEIFGAYSNKHFNLVLGAGSTKEKMNNATEIFDSYYQYSSVVNYKDSNLMQQNIYAFLHADYNFESLGFKEFTVAGGLRLNMHNVYGNNMSFEFSPSYSKDGNTIYFSHSNGFLNPSLYQLYGNDPSLTQFGNNNLSPQYSKSDELGFKTIVSKTTYFTLAFYTITTKDPIQYVNLWDRNRPVDSLSFADFNGSTYLNVGIQENKGLDFSLNLKPNNELSFALRYAYVVSKLTVNLNDVDTTQTNGDHVQLYEGGTFLSRENEDVKMARRPMTIINAIIMYAPSAKLSFRLDTKYTSARNDVFYNSNLGPAGALDSKLLNGYTLMDFYARYFITGNIALGFKVDNLLNTKYSEIIGYRTRGTAYFFDLQVKL